MLDLAGLRTHVILGMMDELTDTSPFGLKDHIEIEAHHNFIFSYVLLEG